MFELIGYFKEYYINDKFAGKVNAEKDREEIGYFGRRSEVLINDVILDNKKKLKAGTQVVTVLYPLNGKRI
jgi:hypothetical protein